MRFRAAVYSPDTRTVLGRVRGKTSSARSLALSLSVRVNAYPGSGVENVRECAYHPFPRARLIIVRASGQ